MRRIGIVLSCLLLLVVPAFAKLDSPAWTEAEKRFKQFFAQAGEAETKIDLVKTVTSDGEPRAWKLLSEGLMLEAAATVRIAEKLSKDLDRLQELLGKKLSEQYPADREEMLRLQVSVSDLERSKAGSESVVKAIVAAFGGATEEARKAALAPAKGHRLWPVRAAAARIAAAAPDEALSKTILAEALSKEADPRVKFATLDALDKAPGKAWQDLVVARIEDTDWGVQLVAARLAGTREIGKAIPALIKALATCTPRVGEEIVKSLRTLTGQSMDAYPEPWAKWWEANRSKWGEDGRPLQPVIAVPRQSDIDIYGLKVKSNKVLFIIDISGSMKEEKKPPPPSTDHPKGPTTGEGGMKEPEPATAKFTGTKMEIAKQEVKRALQKLPKESMFNMISFNHTVNQWQPKMLPATDANKELAYAWMRDLQPAGSTYTDGALRLAFKIAGMGAYDKEYPGVGVDTIILLSDGAPTNNVFPESALMDPEEILKNVREWNSQKRVIINCVGIDNVVQGIEFMKKLAAQNGGTYVDG